MRNPPAMTADQSPPTVGETQSQIRSAARYGFSAIQSFLRISSGLAGLANDRLRRHIPPAGDLTMFRRALVTLLALAPLSTQASGYTLEPNYTQVVFRWDHLGFSKPAAQLSQGEGTLHFDAADPVKSSVSVTFPLATLRTGVPDLDEHLNSEDFFETKKFSKAIFKSTKVEKVAGANKFKVTGTLDLHGITKPVILDVVLLKTGNNPRTDVPTLGFFATSTLKRSDFGLGAFVPQVGDDIRLEITAQAVDTVAHAKYLKAEAEAEAKKKGN
jgi:polyisoprenoid-binding protein YceI